MDVQIEEVKMILKSADIKIKEKIDTNDVNNLILSYEYNKPIPIIYYTKNLTEIKNTKIKCNQCTRIGQYKFENNIFCWIHSHKLNN
jgi:hypothetical protein